MEKTPDAREGGRMSGEAWRSSLRYDLEGCINDNGD